VSNDNEIQTKQRRHLRINEQNYLNI